MMVVEAWTPVRSVTFTGDGYEPDGTVMEDGEAADPSSAADVLDLLTAAALCNDATLLAPSGNGDEWSGLVTPPRWRCSQPPARPGSVEPLSSAASRACSKSRSTAARNA